MAMTNIKVCSEITGAVWKILVIEGQEVEEDETLMILESMKMEIPVDAPEDGVVTSIKVKEGAEIAEGEIVCMMDV